MKVSHAMASQFWEKVEVSTSEDCWWWRRGKNKEGYGSVRVDRKTLCAHRVSWELTYGPIPNGMCVCHTCDNPNHLFLGTHSDNAIDRTRKRRGFIPSLKGSEHGRSKLTEAIVLEMKVRYRTTGIPMSELAREYGVNHNTVSRAVSGATWKHVGEAA